MGTPSNDDEQGKMQKVTQTKLSFCQQSYSLVGLFLRVRRLRKLNKSKLAVK